jgi:Tfp pilus assembly protein PilN
MRAVNLLPRDLEQDKKGPAKPVLAGCAGAVLAAAVLAVGYLQASSAVGSHSAALADAKARLAAIPPPPQAPAIVSQLPQERQARVTALSSALATRVAWDRILREVSLILPDDVWLTSLTGATPTAAAAAPTGQGLHITGFTYSQAAVARLLARLSVLPDLQQVSLTNAATTEVGTRSVVQFDIGADLRTAGATS